MAAFTRTFIGEAAPAAAVTGDLWLKQSTGVLSVCVATEPAPVFAAVGGGSGGTVAVTDAPAGGTGATAGAYDTANNRNALIATVNSMASALRARGIIS